MNNIYHETLGNLNAHKLENEMLREKLNVVKGEYYKSEANGKEEMSSLKAQVAVLREQLANYEIIENKGHCHLVRVWSMMELLMTAAWTPISS